MTKALIEALYPVIYGLELIVKSLRVFSDWLTSHPATIYAFLSPCMFLCAAMLASDQEWNGAAVFLLGTVIFLACAFYAVIQEDRRMNGEVIRKGFKDLGHDLYKYNKEAWEQYHRGWFYGPQSNSTLLEQLELIEEIKQKALYDTFKNSELGKDIVAAFDRIKEASSMSVQHFKDACNAMAKMN